MQKFIQFELWKDCNNHCDFCFNKKQNDINKLKSLILVKQKLLSDEVDNFSEIGFIGGEFFDGQLSDPKVKEKFYDLIKIVADKAKEKKINKFYFATSLIYEPEELKEFIEYIKKEELDRITLICTSFDVKYRFHTPKALDQWIQNAFLIHQENLLLHTEIIVTGFFIDFVLSTNFDLNHFKELYHLSVDFLEPDIGFLYNSKEEMMKDIPDMFPTKKQFIDFLVYADKNHMIDFNTFLNTYLRSDMLYQFFDGELISIDNRCEMLEHNNQKTIGLADTNKSMQEIVEQYKRMTK